MPRRSLVPVFPRRSACFLLAAVATMWPARGEEPRGADDRPAGRAEWNSMLRRDGEGRVLAENRLRALDTLLDDLGIRLRLSQGKTPRP